MNASINVAIDKQNVYAFYEIPGQLRALDHYVLWRKGSQKPDGRFAKIPLDPATLKAGDAHDPKNWLGFDAAVAAYVRGDCDGVGLALDGQQDAQGRYLTCIDLDAAARPELAAELFEQLGQPWMERSPSGTGWHLWMWCRELFKGGNAGQGRELYQRRQFITLTGWESRGALCDATEELRKLASEWFGGEGARALTDSLRGQMRAIQGAVRGVDATTQTLMPQTLPPPAETAEEIKRIKEMLEVLDPDCEYPDWRDIVWAVLSTRWSCAEQLAREWSMGGQKYDAARFDVLVRDYRPGGVGFGTLVYKARAAGYGPRQEAVVAQMTASASATHGDVANGRRFAQLWRGKMVYVATRGAWLRWQEAQWQLCQKGEDIEAAKETAARMVDEARAVLSVDHASGKQHMTHAVASHNIGRLEAMLKLARSEAGMAVVESELDADPHLLGVKNGVVDLRTGHLRPNRPEDYVTRYCSAGLSDGGCPLWLRFLGDVFENDADTIEAVQRLLGYTLTGLCTEEIMVIAYGYGANGKSVFGNVVHSIMGGYSTVAASSLLVTRPANNTGPRDDLAALAGARHVSINELQSGDKLDERVVKVLAGREPISARYLYGSHFTYQPTFTAWLRTNHKPIIHGTDEGIWRRLVLLPFKRQFAPEERDPKLEQKLMAERDGILAWIVAGAVAYLREGLRLSAAMKTEQATYRKESDLMGEFLQDSTQAAPNERIEQSRLYTAWQSWCGFNGVQYGSKKSFTRRLTERGIAEARSNGQRYYCGLKLLV